MELNEFIKISLLDICKGVEAAKRERELDDNSNHTILPEMGHAFADKFGAKLNTHDKNYYQEVEFDIAVTVENKSDVSGKAGVNVFSVGANIGSNLSSNNSTISRLKFRIPIGLSCKNNNTIQTKKENIDEE